MASTLTEDPFLPGGSLERLRATNIPEGTGFGVERVVEATLSTTRGYLVDILKNYGSATQDLGQVVTGFFSKSERGNRTMLGNAGISLAATVASLTRGTANAALGILGGADNLYRKGVVDAHSEISAGSVDRLGLPGRIFGNLRRLGIYTLGTPIRGANELAKLIDMPLDGLHKLTRPAGRDTYSAELRFSK